MTLPRAPDPTIMSMGLKASAPEGALHGPAHLLGGVGPGLDFLLPALVVGDDPLAELGLDLVRFLLVLVEDLTPSPGAS